MNSTWTVNPCDVTVHTQEKKKKEKKKKGKRETENATFISIQTLTIPQFESWPKEPNK